MYHFNHPGRLVADPTVDQLSAIRSGIAELTGREHEVLRLLFTGLTSAEAGNALGKSRRTVENLRERIIQKLGVRNLIEAAALIAVAERTSPGTDYWYTTSLEPGTRIPQ